MSAFLPEQTGVQTAPSVGSGLPQPSGQDIALGSRITAAFAARPQQLLGPLISYIVDAIQVSNLLLPISQIVGFQPYADQIQADQAAISAAAIRAYFATNETERHFTGTTYATITGGAALTGLNDGSYLVLFGASIQATDGDTVNSAVMPNSNSGAISSALEVQGIVVTEHDGPTASTAGGHVSASRAIGVTLAAGAGANTLDIVYKTALGHDCDQRSGWMIALKYA